MFSVSRLVLPSLSQGDVLTHKMADFQTRLKQHINLDMLECYLHHLVSKATRGIFRALCERKKS